MVEVYQALCQYIADHPKGTLAFMVFGTTGYWLFSALTSALPAPEEIWPEKSGRNYLLYKACFQFCHALAGSIGRFVDWARVKWGAKEN